MPKKSPKIPKEQREKNRAAAKPGQKVKFALGRAQTEYEGVIHSYEDPFVLVQVPGKDYLMRAWPTACFPVNE